jgi:hypothetical protein
MQQLIDQLKDELSKMRAEFGRDFGAQISVQSTKDLAEFHNVFLSCSELGASPDQYVSGSMTIDEAAAQLRSRIANQTPEVIAAQMEKQAAELTAKAAELRKAGKTE